MRIEHLEYLIHLAETQSITQTGRELFTTQQNVSKVLRQLEDEMGVVLFTRSQKGLTLTPAGNIMVDFAKYTIIGLQKARSALGRLQETSELQGVLHLYIGAASFSTVFTKIIMTFRSRYPQIILHLHETDVLESLKQVALHENFLAFVPILTNPDFQDIYAPYMEQLRLHALVGDRYMALVNNDLPLAKQSAISVKDFIQYPLAMTQDNHLLLKVFARFGDVTIGFSSNNHTLYTNALASGSCIGATSQRSKASHETPSDFYQSVSKVPFREDLHFNVSLVAQKGQILPPLCQAFVDFFLSHYALREE